MKAHWLGFKSQSKRWERGWQNFECKKRDNLKKGERALWKEKRREAKFILFVSLPREQRKEKRAEKPKRKKEKDKSVFLFLFLFYALIFFLWFKNGKWCFFPLFFVFDSSWNANIFLLIFHQWIFLFFIKVMKYSF